MRLVCRVCSVTKCMSTSGQACIPKGCLLIGAVVIAWISEHGLYYFLSCVGVAPLGIDPSQEQIKGLSLPSFSLAAIQPNKQGGENASKGELAPPTPIVPSVGDGLPFNLSDALPVVPPNWLRGL